MDRERDPSARSGGESRLRETRGSLRIYMYIGLVVNGREATIEGTRLPYLDRKRYLPRITYGSRS